MLKLIRASGLSAVQDLGRFNCLSQGVPVSGVLDPLSLRMGNWALGNQEGAACVEFMGRFDFVCMEPCVLLLSSRLGRLAVNKQEVRSGVRVLAQEGDILQIESQVHAPWVQLCMQGGVEVPLVLGSRSTCMVAGFGGYLGRTLKAGDVICAGTQWNPLPQALALRSGLELKSFRLALPSPHSHEPATLRFIPGPDLHQLPPQAQADFSNQVYRVSSQASRMGYRLDGMPLQAGALKSGPSYVAQSGLIQLPPSGFPIVLLADAQATGGYPRLGTVIQADLWKFAHWGSGQALRFAPVELTAARQALQAQELDFKRMQVALGMRV